MRTATHKAWPKEGIVEPKAVTVSAPAPETEPVVKPVVESIVRHDVLFTLHVKWEHLLIFFLCLVIFFQWSQRDHA